VKLYAREPEGPVNAGLIVVYGPVEEKDVILLARRGFRWLTEVERVPGELILWQGLSAM
jgi:hypothetical protein